MIFLPFIFFCTLTYWLFRKHKRFDVCVYISSLYAFSTFCAILIYYLGLLDEGGVLFDETDYETNLIPTILFCVCLSLSILPFSMIYGNDMKKIVMPNPKLLYVISWILIAVSLLNTYIVADSTLDILQGDLNAVREAAYQGLMTPAQIKAESLPSFLKYLYILNASTYLCLPLFFYYLCFEEKKWWFKTLLFYASLSVPIAGIQAVERTEFMLYVMLFILSLILFLPFLTKAAKRIISVVGTLFIVLSFVFLVAVSLSRFGDREGGAEASAIEYAGQGYLNFCFFWEHANFDIISAEREFPLFYHFVYKIDSTDSRRSERSGQHGFFISVFPTFIGDLMLDISPIGMIVWIIYFFLLCIIVIKQSHRDEFTIGEILAIYVLATIPLFGVFYYRYHFCNATFMLLLTLLIYMISICEIRLWKE